MTYEEQFEKETGRKLGDIEGCYDKDDLLNYRYNLIHWLKSKLTQSEERIKELESEIIVLKETK